MTLFIDASALVAIISMEADEPVLAERIARVPTRLTSGVALWEAARAIARLSGASVPVALDEVNRYCDALSIAIVPIGAPEAFEAARAHTRYGKGTGHPAQLNMGDCFAYACARTHGARLLYKGEDFSLTDLA